MGAMIKLRINGAGPDQKTIGTRKITTTRGQRSWVILAKDTGVWVEKQPAERYMPV